MFELVNAARLADLILSLPSASLRQCGSPHWGSAVTSGSGKISIRHRQDLKMKKDVIVMGAGAAGLMSAIEAGKRGRSIVILEHAEKAGKILPFQAAAATSLISIRLQAIFFPLIPISANRLWHATLRRIFFLLSSGMESAITKNRPARPRARRLKSRRATKTNSAASFSSARVPFGIS